MLWCSNISTRWIGHDRPDGSSMRYSAWLDMQRVGLGDRSRPTAWFVLHRSNDLMPMTRDQAAVADAYCVTAVFFSPLSPSISLSKLIGTEKHLCECVCVCVRACADSDSDAYDFGSQTMDHGPRTSDGGHRTTLSVIQLQLLSLSPFQSLILSASQPLSVFMR